MRRLLLLAGLLASSVLFAQPPLDAAATAFQRALGRSASWTMTRRLPASRKPLVSSGDVTCAVGSGIVWRVTAPFASSVTMTTNAMVFASDEGVREKPLSDLPFYGEIRARTDAFAAGSRAAFDDLFSVEAQGGESGSWSLKLTPKIAAMKRLFVEIDVSGRELPRRATLRSADGAETVIDFRDSGDAR